MYIMLKQTHTYYIITYNIIGTNNVYEMATIANGFKHANPINRQYCGGPYLYTAYNMYII